MRDIKNKIIDKKNKWILNGIFPVKSNFTTEIIAGLILAAIGIPEVMGYAKIAGMPIITGLYTILIPLAIFAIFCSSRHLIIGADSATAAILVSTLVAVAAIGSPNYISLVSWVALICALFLFIARVFKLGFIADFMSRTVLVGFLTGVGIQIALSQLSHMLGIPGGESGLNTVPQLFNIVMNFSQVNLPTIILSAIVIIIILGFRYISPKIPGALIAVIGTIMVGSLLNFSSLGVSTIFFVPNGFPLFAIPSISSINADNFQTLLVAAFTCFIIIIAQSTATARAYAFRFSEETDENKDILGLALANGAAGLTGSFVVNGSPTKTEIARSAGSRSQLTSIVTAVVVLVVLLFLTKPISFLPNATLASIVFIIGLGMVDIKGLNNIRSQIKSEYYLAIITALTVILAGVLWGIILSILLSMLLHLSHSYRAHNSMLIKNEEGQWVFAPVKYGESTQEGILIYRFNRDLYYANSDLLRHQVLKLIKKADKPIEWFVLDASGFEAMDYTSAQMLRDLHNELAKKDIRFIISSTIPQLRDQMDSLGLIKIIGEENIYVTVREALEDFYSKTD